MPLNHDPQCPYCDATWPDGPTVQDYRDDVRVASCPSCHKAITIMTTLVTTATL